MHRYIYIYYNMIKYVDIDTMHMYIYIYMYIYTYTYIHCIQYICNQLLAHPFNSSMPDSKKKRHKLKTMCV